MSKLLNEMYEEVEREQINDKLKEFVDGLSEEEKGRLKKIVNLSEDEPEEEPEEELEEEPAEAPEENTKEVTPSEELVDEIIYNDMKRTEAFRSSKETRHKSSADDQIDILDLNDL